MRAAFLFVKTSMSLQGYGPTLAPDLLAKSCVRCSAGEQSHVPAKLEFYVARTLCGFNPPRLATTDNHGGTNA
jgi:hypothetical protein